MAVSNSRRARSSRYADRLNLWHLELAMTVEVARMLLQRQALRRHGKEWRADCAHIVELRLAELVETCPFPEAGRPGGQP